MQASIVLALAQAEEASAADVDVFLLVTTLLGGLALFLHGMDRMTDALKVVAGDRLRSILGRLTTNRFMGMLTGAGVTAIIQSSSVTTVLVVGFITSELMTVTQSVGVIIGANVGTTITAQIISLNVSRYALMLVALGFGLSFSSKQENWRAWGKVMMGLGLVFFGMGVMGDAMRPLRTFEPFIDAMATMENPLIGILVAALFTALVQSSSATTGLVIVLALQNLISLDAGIALIFGANVGTSVTALLAAIGKPRDALRAGVVHTLFNVIGVLIWLPFIGILAGIVEWMGGDVARQIANAHTSFNVINALLFIGFADRLAKLSVRLVPSRPEAEEQLIRAKYLDRELLRTPSLALDRARLELLRMADRVRTMLMQILPAILDGPRSALGAVETLDDEVDALHGHIITYLGQISQQPLGQNETEELMDLMEATNNLEAIGDIIETNLVGLGFSRIEGGVQVSAQTRRVLSELHRAISDAYDLAMVAVTQRNQDAARRVSSMKKEINSLERSAVAHEAARLVADAPHRLEAYRFETDVIANFHRIYFFTRRTARAAVAVTDQATSG
ncbi:MAG: Na/Pi cotransporter family protein [Acidimicrobiia bacterium]|nr:Na/Pi cotransporter family protein [Acidimicrobiia bacterium]